VQAEATKNTLIVSIWNKGLIQYRIEEQDKYEVTHKLQTEDITDIKFDNKGEVFAISTSNGLVSMYTKDFIYLKEVYKSNEWIWSISLSLSIKMLLSGTSEGIIRAHKVGFNKVHAVYKNLYAYRDRLTNIIVRNIETDISVRIRYKKYVRNIAVYASYLAVQLADEIIVYRLLNTSNMRYEMARKIKCEKECNILLMGGRDIILCHEKRMLQVNLLEGEVEEWLFDSNISLAKVVGGPIGRENVIVALENGDLFKVFIGSSLPVLLMNVKVVVCALDYSCEYDHLAIIDCSSKLFLYNIKEKKVVHEDVNVTSVAYNKEVNDLLAYSKEGKVLAIKSGNLPVTLQGTPGTVISFKRSKVYIMERKLLKEIDIAQSGIMRKYVERKMFVKAYKIGCLGVNKQDWLFLAFEAIKNKEFVIARKVFIKLKNMKYLELAATTEEMSKMGESNSLIEAEILASQKNYKEAAHLLIQDGNYNKTLELYVELKMWKNVDKIKGKINELENPLVPVNMKDLINIQVICFITN